MSWAERLEKWREDYVHRRRIQLFMLGAMIAAAGAWPLYSDTLHQLTGRSSTATLIEHVRECTVEYQRVGESRRKEPMACDAAEAFQQRIGSNKVKVSENSFARVRFSLADGQAHEAKVPWSKLGYNKPPVGTKIAVVYAPDHPADVRVPLTWERLKVSLMLFAVGLVIVLLAFGVQIIAALYAWVSSRRTMDDGDASLISPLATQTVSERRGAAPRMTGSAPRTTFGRR